RFARGDVGVRLEEEAGVVVALLHAIGGPNDLIQLAVSRLQRILPGQLQAAIQLPQRYSVALHQVAAKVAELTSSLGSGLHVLHRENLRPWEAVVDGRARIAPVPFQR